MYEYEVVSFFIDAVDRYRKYDDEGNPVKGDCARMFEEEYRRLARHPDHRTLFEGMDLDDGESIGAVHDGYFTPPRPCRERPSARGGPVAPGGHGDHPSY